MSAQDVILGARVAHVRELKAEIERLRAANARLSDESAALQAHFDLALVAAAELRGLPEGGRLVIVDGWNQILGTSRTAHDRGELYDQWRRHLADHPLDRVWIVLDGRDENVRNEDRLRISYTGGSGLHRADRFVCDFLRMARYLDLAGRIEVRTGDRDFRREALRLGASCPA